MKTQTNSDNKIDATTDTNRRPDASASRQRRGLLFALIGGALWGFSGACGQFLFRFEAIDSGWLTVTRMLLSGIILLTVSLLQPAKRPGLRAVWQAPKDALRLIIFSLLGLTSCQYTYLTAISYSNAGTATVLQYLGPALILIVTCVMALRLPSRRELLAVLLAIGGTFLLATHGVPGSLVISQKGLFWGLASAVALMLYTMLPGDLIRRYGSTVIVGYGMLLGGLFLFFVLGYWRYHIDWEPALVFGVAAIVLVGTALAFTLYLQGVSDAGSVKASMAACVEPVSATLLSVFWLGTSFAPIDAVGLLMIVTTVLLLSYQPKH